MRVIGPSCPRPIVDVRRPPALVAGVVGEARYGVAETLVAGPPEPHRLVLARPLGYRAHAGQSGDRFGAVVGLPAIAPLGEHLGGVDPTGPWQGSEDLGVRMLAQSGGD